MLYFTVLPGVLTRFKENKSLKGNLLKKKKELERKFIGKNKIKVKQKLLLFHVQMNYFLYSIINRVKLMKANLTFSSDS